MEKKNQVKGHFYFSYFFNTREAKWIDYSTQQIGEHQIKIAKSSPLLKHFIKYFFWLNGKKCRIFIKKNSSGENFGSLSDFDFEISILALSTLIGLPLDIISKCVNILSKPTEPKVSSADISSYNRRFSHCNFMGI